MPFYHATARKAGSATPFSVMFQAADSTAAVGELCDAAGVHGTSGLTEFEILEVLGNGHYRRAALKETRSTTTKERLAANTAPVVPPQGNTAIVATEKVYTPYTHKQAA